MVVESPNFITLRQPLTIARQQNAPVAIQLKRDNSPELLTMPSVVQGGKNAEARTEYEQYSRRSRTDRDQPRHRFTYGREGKHPEALKYLDLALVSEPRRHHTAPAAAAERDSGQRLSAGDGLLAKVDIAAMADPVAPPTRR